MVGTREELTEVLVSDDGVKNPGYSEERSQDDVNQRLKTVCDRERVWVQNFISKCTVESVAGTVAMGTFTTGRGGKLASPSSGGGTDLLSVF